ncbi:MAG TPA: prolyl oligopeptidase family serine peptidase [Gemmatimonadales bacterium]|nr:prolyl oligopeptidase family serine peptidase [Gemmatimonadales bacterium]
MFLRLLVLTALVIVPRSSAIAQEYSAGIPADYDVIPNVTYLEQGGWQGKLDLYARADTLGPHPTVIFFHGGSDDRGSKERVLFNLLRYMELGWNVVNVEHRLPGVTLAPAAMQNGWCAARWVVRNADLYGFDVNKIVVSGQSSGGWAALTAAMAPKGLGWEQMCPGTEDVKVAAIVNWCGVSDPVDSLERRGPGIQASFRGLPNPTEVAKVISPVHLVRSSGPPVISIHGDADNSVPYTQSLRLHDTLKKVGVIEELITIPRGGHCGFSRSVTQKAYAAIEDFLRRLGIGPVPTGELVKRTPTLSFISVDSTVASRYTGRYRDHNGNVLAFTQKDGRFFVEYASSQVPIEVFPSSEREFFVKSGNSGISFVVDNQGRTKGAITRVTSGKYLRLPRIE